MTVTRERWSKAQVAVCLPTQGAPAATAYCRPGDPLPGAALASIEADDADRLREAAAASDTGAIFVATAERTLLIVPPFPVESASMSDDADAAPLLELMARPRAIGVFLLRMGGYSVGFFRGDALIDSKTGGRFVKNRHRKGGQSQRRFDRIREKQTHEHFGDACDTAKRILAPRDAEMERIFLGGDRHTLQAFRKECDAFERYGPRLATRVLAVPGDPRLNLLEAMPREVWSSDVYVVTRP